MGRRPRRLHTRARRRRAIPPPSAHVFRSETAASKPGAVTSTNTVPRVASDSLKTRSGPLEAASLAAARGDELVRRARRRRAQRRGPSTSVGATPHAPPCPVRSRRRIAEREAAEGLGRRPIDADVVRPRAEHLVDRAPARHLGSALAAATPEHQHVRRLLTVEGRDEARAPRHLQAIHHVRSASRRRSSRRRRRATRTCRPPRCRSSPPAPTGSGTASPHRSPADPEPASGAVSSQQRVAAGRVALPGVGEDGVGARIEETGHGRVARRRRPLRRRPPRSARRRTRAGREPQARLRPSARRRAPATATRSPCATPRPRPRPRPRTSRERRRPSPRWSPSGGRPAARSGALWHTSASASTSLVSRSS